MDITVYLPNELGNEAKARDFPLSRMLRQAVIERIADEDALVRLKAETLAKMYGEDVPA